MKKIFLIFLSALPLETTRAFGIVKDPITSEKKAEETMSNVGLSENQTDFYVVLAKQTEISAVFMLNQKATEILSAERQKTSPKNENKTTRKSHAPKAIIKN